MVRDDHFHLGTSSPHVLDNIKDEIDFQSDGTRENHYS
jgi:hypothetical protein